MTITVFNETSEEFTFSITEVANQVIQQAFIQEQFPYEAEVSVTLVAASTIQELNKDNRGIDRVTDVLSFPMVDYPAAGDFSQMDEDSDIVNPDTGEILLGDIVICVEQMKAQALEYGHSIKREYAFLVTHSILHLLGYDHMIEEEEHEMFAKQDTILGELKIVREDD